MKYPQQQRHLSSNPSFLKARFTRRFVRALVKINSTQKPISSSSSRAREIFLRYRRIKLAAHKSMAYAIGSRRAWSRALLLKAKKKKQQQLQASSSVRRMFNNTHHAIKVKQAAAATANIEEEEAIEFVQENELRKLVPGGKAMDLCSLLDETAHYVKCLATQVQVMRKIVDFYST